MQEGFFAEDDFGAQDDYQRELDEEAEFEQQRLDAERRNAAENVAGITLLQEGTTTSSFPVEVHGEAKVTQSRVSLSKHTCWGLHQHRRAMYGKCCCLFPCFDALMHCCMFRGRVCILLKLTNVMPSCQGECFCWHATVCTTICVCATCCQTAIVTYRHLKIGSNKLAGPLQALHWKPVFRVKGFRPDTQRLADLVSRHTEIELTWCAAEQNAAAAQEPSSSSSAQQTNGNPSSNLKISDEDQQQLFDDDDDDDEDLDDDDGDMSDEELDQLQNSVNKSSLH